MKTRHAFTLLELLVAITIIAILISIIIPAVISVQRAGDRTHATSNFRTLAAGMLTYVGSHSFELPPEGESLPTWESSTFPDYAGAWYNSIPRTVGSKGVADFADSPDSFYTKKNLLFIPAAQYPKDKNDRPMFAVSMNSKLRREGIADGRVRLTNMQQPARTVIFQESGLPGEEALRGQDASKYNGQSKSFANRTAARYAGRAHLIFGDGHVELLDAKDVVTPDGKAFYPQISDQGGKVLWTLDPEMDANKNK